MRNLSLAVLLLFCASASAQLLPTEPDKSPMDMSYSPNGYPVLKIQNKTIGKPNARIIYSRPQKKGRKIFGTEVKYNEVWRMGANESTELELYKSATIGGKKIPKGRYTLFCIPQPDNWTIIISKDLNSWGAFSYSGMNDLARIPIKLQKTDAPIEYFTLYFDSTNALIMLWDDVKAVMPIQFLEK